MVLLALWLLIVAPTLAVAKKNSKRGITFPATDNPQDVLNINQTQSVISWIYDWALSPPSYLVNTSIEYVPMQWGAGNIENLASAVKNQSAKTLLTFNEPDFDQQSNLDATYAAELWQKYIDPLKDEGVRLGGPAITSSSTGLPWLRQFMTACSNCTIDFLTVHWYGEGTAGFYDYLWSLHGQYPNHTVWVTEYADTEGNATDVLQFINQTTTYLESLDWIERYAWFGYFRPENGTFYNLLDADGGLNALGQTYIGAGTVERSGPATASPTTEGAGPTDSFVTISAPTNVATHVISGASSHRSWGSSGLWMLSCLVGTMWLIN